jgi:alpha-L-fucosidase
VREYYGTDLVLPATINMLDLRENIEAGQQVSAFAVDALVDGSWTEVASGTTIGHRRLLTLPEPITPPTYASVSWPAGPKWRSR